MLLLQLLQGLSELLVVLSSFLAILATILQRLLALLSLINKQLIHSLPTHNCFKLFPVPQVSRTASVAFIVHCKVIAIRDCKGALRKLQQLLVGDCLPYILFGEVLLSDIKIARCLLLHDDT